MRAIRVAQAGPYRARAAPRRSSPAPARPAVGDIASPSPSPHRLADHPAQCLPARRGSPKPELSRPVARPLAARPPQLQVLRLPVLPICPCSACCSRRLIEQLPAGVASVAHAARPLLRFAFSSLLRPFPRPYGAQVFEHVLQLDNEICLVALGRFASSRALSSIRSRSRAHHDPLRLVERLLVLLGISRHVFSERL